MSDHPPGSEWKDAGRFTVCSIVDDQIYAVLYWSDGFAAQAPWEESFSPSGAGWFLVFADDPEPQLKLLDAPDATQDMSADELAAVTREAVGFASAMIRKRLGLPPLTADDF